MFTVRRRGLAAHVGTIAVAIGAIAALALPGASAATSLPASPSSPASSTASAAQPGPNPTKCTTTGVSTTCIGNYNGPSGYNAWDPWTNTNISHPPVVTVNQTKSLTDQIVNVSWQYFTPSLDSGTQGPNPVSPGFYRVNIYQCKGTNPTWNSNGLSGCFPAHEGIPGQGAPGNAVTASTIAPGANGTPQTWGGPSTATGGDPTKWTGSTQFHIEAGAEQNNLLGCDASTPCSLMIIPNFGGNWSYLPGGSANPSNTDTTQCLNHSYDSFNAGGIGTNNAGGDVNGIDWACSYMDRIVVPLHFAPTTTNCPQQTPAFYAQGSPMMARQMTQWQSAWCNGSAPVSLTFTQTSESTARSKFLQGQAFGASVDMALTTLPATASQVSSSSRKFTYAPLANSGTAIAYYLDDAQPPGNPAAGQPLNQVVLDPRLVAKLTTESYSLSYDCTAQNTPPPWKPPPAASIDCDPAVSHNTRHLFDDKEFLSLNKNCQPAGVTNYVCGAGDFPNDTGLFGNMPFGPYLPTVLGPQSDMTYQLTSWVGANAAAKAFLGGQPDQQGMHVNTYYKGTSYPVQSFQTGLDPGVKWPQPLKCTATGCVLPGTASASMNVAWNFLSTLGNVASNLLAFQPNAYNTTLTCLNTSNTCTNITQYGYPHLSPQVLGSRALFSEMDLGDVGAYQFPAAALVNAAGKAVPPTKASVDAAVRDMKTNPDGITQYVNLSGKDPAAYPLAMVDYAMVPTCGLPHAEASAIADFLDKAATTGQTQGVFPGQLGPGYYPLTSAQRAQTLKAAQEVKAQHCPSAPPKGHKPGKHTTTPTSPGTTPTSPATTPTSPATTPTSPGTTPTSPGTTPTSPGTTPTAPAGAAPTGPGGTTPPGRSSGAYNNAAYGQKSSDSGISGILLPGILLMLLGALLVGSAVWALAATGRWPAVRRRVQGLFRGQLVRRAQAR